MLNVLQSKDESCLVVVSAKHKPIVDIAHNKHRRSDFSMFPKILSVPTVNSLDNISIEAYTYDLGERITGKRPSLSAIGMFVFSVVSVPVQKVCAVQTLGPNKQPPMDLCHHIYVYIQRWCTGQYFST